jgi:hypothetical protein
MGVYGNFFYPFPEQFRSGTYFFQEPKINSGYDRGEDPPDETPIIGIFQNNATDVHDKNGNLMKRKGLYLWVESVLQEGCFVRFEDVVYRIVNGNDWPSEGGFYEYGIERLGGDNGDDTTEPAINTGGNLLS